LHCIKFHKSVALEPLATVYKIHISFKYFLFGTVSITTTQTLRPLERIKMFPNGRTAAAQHCWIISRHTPQRGEGFVGGQWCQSAHIFPAKAVVFSSNDIYKSMLINLTNTKTANSTSSSGSKQGPAFAGPLSFLAGGLAGMTASALTYPLICQGRYRASWQRRREKGIRWIIQTVLTVKDEGVRALYKGVTPTILRCHAARRNQVWDGWIVGELVSRNEMPRKERRPCASQNAFGGLGGVMAGLITYPKRYGPTITAKCRAVEGHNTLLTSYWIVSANVQRAHGIARFYRSLPLTLFAWHPMRLHGSYELKQWTANICV
jgi:solute carrier family 25 phosphate transporter 23/24/25/41